MSNEYKDWYNDFTDEQKKNYELCMKYPILIPGTTQNDYMYEYTWLDSMPEGWRVAFGEQWADSLQVVINKLPEEERDGFCIMDIKEKYGSLVVYLSRYNIETENILKKYEDVSKRVCIKCGRVAIKDFSKLGLPCCNLCAEKYN